MTGGAHDADAARFVEQASRWSGADALWTHRAGPPVRAVIPADGCADLIVDMSADGRVRARVHAPTAEAQTVHIADDAWVFGVRFRPGYGMAAMARAAQLAQLAAQEFERNPEIATLDALVGEQLGRRSDPPALIREFLAFVHETGGRGRVPDLARGPGAERRLQRAAQRWLGMSPKHFMRIVRARQAQQAICRQEPLGSVAVACGFSDQAHLNRELRALIGYTPGQVRSVGKVQDVGRPRRHIAGQRGERSDDHP